MVRVLVRVMVRVLVCVLMRACIHPSLMFYNFKILLKLCVYSTKDTRTLKVRV